MYHVVFKTKDGAFLLDKINSLLFSSFDEEKAWSMFEFYSSLYDRTYNLYLVESASSNRDKQFLTVLANY